MLALALVVGGLVAYRWDTNLSGQLIVLTYLPSDVLARYTSYVPSIIEMVSGAGIVAYGLMAYTIGVRYFRVVDHSEQELVPEAKKHPLPVAGD